MGKVGRAERDALYKRLAKATPQDLPSSQTVADIVIETDQGAHHLPRHNSFPLYVLHSKTVPSTSGTR